MPGRANKLHRDPISQPHPPTPCHCRRDRRGRTGDACHSRREALPGRQDRPARLRPLRRPSALRPPRSTRPVVTSASASTSSTNQAMAEIIECARISIDRPRIWGISSGLSMPTSKSPISIWRRSSMCRGYRRLIVTDGMRHGVFIQRENGGFPDYPDVYNVGKHGAACRPPPHRRHLIAGPLFV